jgi:hypothetical protein
MPGLGQGANERKLLITYKEGSDTQGSEKRAAASMTSASEQNCKIRGGQTVLFKQGMPPFPINGNPGGFLGACVRDKLEHGASSQGSVAELGSGDAWATAGADTAKHWIVDSRRSKGSEGLHSGSMCLYHDHHGHRASSAHDVVDASRAAANSRICPRSTLGN